MASESQAVEQKADDIATQTRMMLSAVAHMDGQWGTDVVAKVLCGSEANRVLEPELDELTVYGLLDDLSQRVVRNMLKLLLERKVICRVPHGAVKLRPIGVAVMKGNARLSAEMRQMLQEIRDRYVAYDPAERYSPESETIQKTLRLFEEGVHPKMIAKRRELSEETIAQHAVTLAAQGQTFDLSAHLDGELLEELSEKAGDWDPGEPIKRVRNSLEEDCGWPKLKFHLVQMWMDRAE